mgnify:CR=1 FL=1|jgi:hypothetical protein
MNGFEECVKNLDNLLNSMSIKQTLGRRMDILKNAKEFIVHDIKLAQEDKEVKITDCNIRTVINSLNILHDIFIDFSVSQEFLGLMMNFSLLAFNWSNELAKNDEIIKMAKIVDRFAQYHMTSVEMLDLTKKMLSQMRDMSNYAFPGVELSKHYLQSIDNRLREQNGNMD